jgi:hypothetical protein
MKRVAFILSWLLLPLCLYCQTIESFTADWKKRTRLLSNQGTFQTGYIQKDIKRKALFA